MYPQPQTDQRKPLAGMAGPYTQQAFSSWATGRYGRAPDAKEFAKIGAHVGPAGGANGAYTADQYWKGQQFTDNLARQQYGWNGPALENPQAPQQPVQAPQAPVTPDIQFNVADAPAFEVDAYQRPGAFKAPTRAEAEDDEGYQFALGEQLKRLEASKAYSGNLRTTGAMRHVADVVRGASSDQYDKVYGRRAAEHDRSVGEGMDAYGVNYTRARDQYAPRLATWEGRQLADARGRELNFDRGWQREVYGGDDRYRRDQMATQDRWRTDDRAWDRERYQGDDRYRRDLFEDDRLRYLADRGY